MRLHRRFDKKDKNHKEIMMALRKVGARVADTSMVGGGFPDMVCKFRGTLYLVEAKADDGKFTDKEDEFYNEWKDVTIVARSPEEALKGIGAIDA